MDDDGRSRKRDIAIARGLGYDVYLTIVLTGYQHIENEDIDKVEPCYNIVPIIIEDGCAIYESFNGTPKHIYVLNVVPSYSYDADEAQYLAEVDMQHRGWQMIHLSQYDGNEWLCTYENTTTLERCTCEGETELDAKAEAACAALNTKQWEEMFEEPTLVSFTKQEG